DGAHQSLFFGQRTANNLDGFLLSQADQATAHCSDAKVRIARSNRDGHRLGSFEVLQLNVKASFLVVATLKSNEARRMAGEAHDADIDLRVCTRGQTKTNQRGGRTEAQQRLTAVKGKFHLSNLLPKSGYGRHRIGGWSPPSTIIKQSRRLSRRTP